jgi:hypothetical protein
MSKKLILLRERERQSPSFFFIMVMGVSQSSNFLNNQSHHQEMIEEGISSKEFTYSFSLDTRVEPTI